MLGSSRAMKPALGEIRRVEALNRLAERSTELSPEHHFVLSKSFDETDNRWMELAKKGAIAAGTQESIAPGRWFTSKSIPIKRSWRRFASFEERSHGNFSANKSKTCGGIGQFRKREKRSLLWSRLKLF